MWSRGKSWNSWMKQRLHNWRSGPPRYREAHEKHFNSSLTEPNIVKDFSKPKIKTPTLDDQFKDHLKRKGKDPHFGDEKSLYKISEVCSSSACD